MISRRDEDGQIKHLDPDQLAGIRNAWGGGVPLRMLASQHGLTEQELRVQLREPAWLALPPNDRQVSQ